MSKTLETFETERKKAIAEMELMISDNPNGFTQEQQSKFDSLKSKAELAKIKIEEYKASRPISTGVTVPDILPTNYDTFNSGWTDTQGRSVKVYSPTDKLGSGEFSVGKYIKGALSGNWSGAEREHGLFAATTTNQAGGAYLMPSVLQSEFIDLFRANTVLVQAGANTVELQSGSDKIARVISDPTAQVKVELEAFDGSNPNFDLVSFTPFTIGAYVQISKELAQDAQNIEQILQSTMSAAVGQKLDLLGLYGAGTTEPVGLLNYDSINAVPVDTFDYDTILDGLAENEKENCYTSSVYVCSPSVSNTLSKLKETGTGAYLVPPVDVQKLRKLVSTNVEDTDLVLGDFSNLYLGIRSGISFESSPIAGDSFSKYALAFRIVLRADWQVIRPKAFCLCSQNIS